MAQDLCFGILVLQEYSYQELLLRWKLIEELNFDSLWVADHFVDPYTKGLWFDGWTLLTAAAALTSHVKIGTLVSSITLHNPAMLAKQAMTVDHISDGRLIMGIGAGRAPLDHSMTGVPNWELAERSRRFREFIEILHHMLTNQVTTYEGRYYQVMDAVVNPASVQQPLPRLMLAAHGEKSLKLTAQFANTWNTFLKFNATAQEAQEIARQHSDKLNEACASIGRDPAEISRSLLCGLTQDRFFASRDAFHDAIGSYREIGFNEFIFYWTADEVHPVFPNHRETTIPNRSTLEWVAEEIAALKAR